jgi:predicted ribosome-associated RNA-binding protein Tma20
MSKPSVVEVGGLGREGLINELVKLLLNDDAKPMVFNPGGRRTVLKLGCLNEAPKEYTVVIIDIGEAKSN